MVKIVEYPLLETRLMAEDINLNRVNERITIKIPVNAWVMEHLTDRMGKLCLWAMVNPDEKEEEERFFRVISPYNRFNVEKLHLIGILKPELNGIPSNDLYVFLECNPYNGGIQCLDAGTS